MEEEFLVGVDSIVTGLRIDVVTDLEHYISRHVSEDCFDELKLLFSKYRDCIKSGRSVNKKRILSPYNLFIRDAIHRIKMDNPSMKGQDLMRKATESWLAHKASIISESS